MRLLTVILVLAILTSFAYGFSEKHRIEQCEGRYYKGQCIGGEK